MFSLNNIINPIISLILVIIVCSLIGIDKENIIVIVLISCIVLFLFKIILDINKFYNDSLNSIDNISKLDYNNYIKQQIQKNHKDSIIPQIPQIPQILIIIYHIFTNTLII